MYELEDIESKNWFENVFNTYNAGGSHITFSTKSEVLEWLKDNNTIVNFIIISKLSKFTRQPELRSLSNNTMYLINMDYQKITFIFESEDDYSLFKLIWM